MHTDQLPIFSPLWAFWYFHLFELCVAVMPRKHALYLCFFKFTGSKNNKKYCADNEWEYLK